MTSSSSAAASAPSPTSHSTITSALIRLTATAIDATDSRNLSFRYASVQVAVSSGVHNFFSRFKPYLTCTVCRARKLQFSVAIRTLGPASTLTWVRHSKKKMTHGRMDILWLSMRAPVPQKTGLGKSHVLQRGGREWGKGWAYDLAPYAVNYTSRRPGRQDAVTPAKCYSSKTYLIFTRRERTMVCQERETSRAARSV